MGVLLYSVLSVIHRSIGEFDTVDDQKLFEIVNDRQAVSGLDDPLFGGFSMSQILKGLYTPETDILHAVTVEEWEIGLRVEPSDEETNPLIVALEDYQTTGNAPAIGIFDGEMLTGAQETFRYKSVGEGGLVAACVQIIAWDK